MVPCIVLQRQSGVLKHSLLLDPKQIIRADSNPRVSKMLQNHLVKFNRCN